MMYISPLAHLEILWFWKPEYLDTVIDKLLTLHNFLNKHIKWNTHEFYSISLGNVLNYKYMFQNIQNKMAVLVFLVEFIAVVMVTLFLALLTTLLLVLANVLGFLLRLIVPVTWVLIYATTKLGIVIQYNMDCFSALYHKSPEDTSQSSSTDSSPGFTN